MSDLYQASVPLIIHKLGILKHICQVGEKHAQDQDLDATALTGFRLYPDMLPFSAQIKLSTEIICGMTSRLTGNQRLSLNDNDANFVELMARIDTTVTHLKEQKSEDYAGAESREVVLKTPADEMKFSGAEYVANFVLPNLYFHMTTAYNILRHNGVKLGKLDFLRGG